MSWQRIAEELLISETELTDVFAQGYDEYCTHIDATMANWPAFKEAIRISLSLLLS